jgi:hypothetical protein
MQNASSNVSSIVQTKLKIANLHLTRAIKKPFDRRRVARQFVLLVRISGSRA